MRHREKFEEAQFHLEKMEASFRAGNNSHQHYLNSFLSATQSVFFCLNKEFNGLPRYCTWRDKRSDRLPSIAKIFKELRNISEKEGSVKNSVVITGFTFEQPLPAHATFTGPWLDTITGKLASNKGTITTIEGTTIEVDVEPLYDFTVVVTSGNKVYRLEQVVFDSRCYLEAIQKEMDEAERRFLPKSQK